MAAACTVIDAVYGAHGGAWYIYTVYTPMRSPVRLSYWYDRQCRRDTERKSLLLDIVDATTKHRTYI
jgi:hypothetical protein